MLGENLIKVNKKWCAEGLKLAPPFPVREVAGIFADFGITLARDAVEVYSTLGGFADDEMDSECLTFWSPRKILRENEFYAEQVYFADFLIYSHQYYFEYKNSESSTIHISYGETERYKIADSFDEFFELYLKNIKGLFP